MSKPVFPIIRKETPLLDVIRKKIQGPGTSALGSAEKIMTEEFRMGIAEKLGVSPEAINGENLQKWVINMSRALLKPELWTQQGYAKRLGQDLINLLPPRIPQPPTSQETNRQEVRMPPRGSGEEEQRRERYNRSELSVAK